MNVSARDVVLDRLKPGDAGWLIMRHAELYARDEGFDSSFEPLVARILADFIEGYDPEVERGWIMRANTEVGEVRLGSIFCVRGPEDGVAKLRLFLVEPTARGLGLGQVLLDACIEFAREAGYNRMTLWTHESHRAACALYAKAGFTCTRSDPVRSFGVELVEQVWTLSL